MQKLRKPIVAIALALVGSLSAGTIALAESASGSGATFPQNFMASATVAFNQATGHNVSYANPGGGSTKGKSDFKAGLTDFGGSDSAVLRLKPQRLTGFTYLMLQVRFQLHIASTKSREQLFR